MVMSYYEYLMESEFMLEDDIASQAKGLGLVHVGKGFYAPSSSTTKGLGGRLKLKPNSHATYQIKNGKLVPITHAAEPDIKTLKSKLTGEPLPKTTEDPEKEAETLFSNLQAIKILRNSKHPLVTSGDLENFLENPSVSKAATLVAAYDLRFDNGKLYALKDKMGRKFIGEDRKPLGESSTGRLMGKAVADVLAKYGSPITVQHATGTVLNAGEYFKPTRLYQKTERTIVHIKSIGENDIQIGNEKLHRFNSQEKKEYVKRWIAKYEQQNKNVDADKLEEVEDLLNQIIDSNNQKITTLTQLQNQEVVVAEGIKDIRRIAQKILGPTGVINSLTESGQLSPDDSKNIKQSLTEIFSSTSQLEFKEKVGTIMKLIESSGIKSAAPILGENLAQVFYMLGGDTVFIPMNDSFQLSDLIALNSSALETPLDIINQVKFVQTVSQTSVKKDKGNASTTHPRVEQSTFFDDNYPSIKTDLSTLSFSVTKNLWSKEKSEQRATQQNVEAIFKKYLPVIQKYYGVDLDEEKLKKALSTGKRFICMGGKPIPPSTLASPMGKPGVDNTAWKYYSLAGYTMEALYNSMVHRQDFTTFNVSDKGIKEANGITNLTRIEFSFYKGKGIKPDQNMGSYSKVSRSKKDLRIGSPCLRKQMKFED